MKKKKMFISFMALVMLFAFSQMAMAYTVQTVGIPSGNQYGPYQTGSGGEFTLLPAGGLPWDPNSYSLSTKNQVQGYTTFQSFCVEDHEYIWAGITYTAILNTAAVAGGVGPAGDPISVGTAYLYYQFAMGTLAGYDYSRANTTMILDLQNAIWYLEDEGGYLTSAYIGLLSTALGGDINNNTWKADNNGAYPVYALNLWVPGYVGDFTKNYDGTYAFLRQDMLVVATPIPAAAWLLGSGLIGLVVVRRRMKK